MKRISRFEYFVRQLKRNPKFRHKPLPVHATAVSTPTLNIVVDRGKPDWFRRHTDRLYKLLWEARRKNSPNAAAITRKINLHLHGVERYAHAS